VLTLAVIALVVLLVLAPIPINLPFFGESPPDLISPEMGETLLTHYPTFEWSEEDADLYQLSVMNTEQEAVIDTEVENCSYQSGVYFEDDIYRWRVRASSDGTWTEWSEEGVFFVGSETINRHYEWVYEGRTWTWDVMIENADYLFYHQKPRTYDYASYMTDDDAYIESLAEELNDIADVEGWSTYELVSFALAFVQSLEYTSDSVTTGYDEYPRYPLETLVDNGGDCEDTSILLASLVQADPINIDAVLLLLPSDSPEHMATGVAGEEGISGYYFPYDGRRYYYCETTGQGWELGDIPDDYAGVSARIIQV